MRFRVCRFGGDQSKQPSLQVQTASKKKCRPLASSSFRIAPLQSDYPPSSELRTNGRVTSRFVGGRLRRGRSKRCVPHRKVLIRTPIQRAIDDKNRPNNTLRHTVPEHQAYAVRWCRNLVLNNPTHAPKYFRRCVVAVPFQLRQLMPKSRRERSIFCQNDSPLAHGEQEFAEYLFLCSSLQK